MREKLAERTLLGGALSYEFSDCSIAASDLSTKANDRIVEDPHRKPEDFFVIGEDNDQQLCNVVLKYNLNDGKLRQYLDFEVDGRPAELRLLYPTETRQVPGEPTETKKGILRRVVNTTPLVEQGFCVGDPFMGITIGQGALLPLASFARREGGKCSYVQLGQEMKDDNYYVTTADDDTERHILIEALRTLIQGTENNFQPPTLSAKDVQTIQSFIDSQLEAHRSALDRAYEIQLVEKYFRLLAFENEDRKLTFLNSAEISSAVDCSTYSVVAPRVIKSGRSVELVISQIKKEPGQENGFLQLLAVGRGGVAVELANMSQQMQSVEFSEGLVIGDSQSLIRQLYFFNESPIPAYKIEPPSNMKYHNNDLDEVDKAIAVFCEDADLVYDAPSDDYRDEDVELELERFFANPTYVPNPYPSSKPLHVALHTLEKNQIKSKDLLSKFAIEDKFKDQTGKLRICDDQLMYALDKLAPLGEASAIFKNVSIGKTSSDAVIAATCERSGVIYKVSITGRPTSMPHEPMKTILSFQVNPSLPNLGHAKDVNGLFSEDNVTEVCSILLKLCSEAKKIKDH